MTRQFLLVFLLALRAAGGAAVFHVSPQGNDAEDGSDVAPFRTLGHALEAASKRPPGPAVIHLGKGCHRIEETVSIDSRHAGDSIGTLAIEAAPGAILSGFIPIPAEAWAHPDEATKAMLPSAARMEAMVLDFKSAGLGDPGLLSRRGFSVGKFEQSPPALLFAGGNRMVLSRWPDQGSAKPEAVLDAGPSSADAEAFATRGGKFAYRHPRLSSWTNEKDLWLDGVMSQDWVWTFNRVKAIDPREGSLSLAQGEVNGLKVEQWNHPWFILINALSEITMPGEYHLDTAGSRLVFWPPSSLPDWKASARLLGHTGPILHVNGAKGLALRGITLEGTRGNLLAADNVKDLTIEKCHFRQAGGNGAGLQGKGIHLRDCLFEGLGGSGIRLSGGDEQALEPSGHVVEHCTFRDLAWWNKVYRPGILLEGVGHEVKNSLFEDLPHMAIEVKGNNFEISGNCFRRISMGFRDMGAVYLNLGENPLRRGTLISRNVFSDIGRQGGKRCALYLDNATNGVTVRENLFDGIGGESGDWAVMIHGGDHNLIEGNLFNDCTLPCKVGFFFATWGKDLLPDAREKWKSLLTAPEAATRLAIYPELNGFLEGDRVTPANNIIRDNMVSTSAPAPSIVLVEGGPPERVTIAGNQLVDRLPDTPLLDTLLEVKAKAGKR